jgi:hypothetical protein
MVIERARKRLDRKVKKGLRGWPLATVALYGPNDRLATKLSVGIVPGEGAEVTDLRRWLSEGQADIRADSRVAEEVLAFIAEAGAKSVAMTDRIIGCPHEEGIDYEGSTCPVCPFWAGRDRWTGKRLR